MEKLESAELPPELAPEIFVTSDIPTPPGGGSWIWNGKEWQPKIDPEPAPIEST